MINHATSPRPPANQVVFALVAIFLVALGMRLLSRHDAQHDVWKVQTVVAEDYQRAAGMLREGGLRGFFSARGPLADPNLLGHPPGYPIVIATVWSVFGESDKSIQLLQIFVDSLAAVLIFLIALELLPFSVALIAGLLVALAPQFTWNSVLLLPDTLAVFPVLLGIYCLVRAVKKPRLVSVLAAGALIGLSCWLRANALLMAPFLAVIAFFLFDRARRLRYSMTLMAGAILILAPLTIRNWIVFHHFIPVSLGAGQTMLEGIADYDTEGRFGIPSTDMGIMKMEAEQYGRPDYYSTLFAPDGIARDRQRLARGFDIVRHNPFWFAGVMVRRATAMLRLERTPKISAEPVIDYGVHDLNDAKRVLVVTPGELYSKSIVRAGEMFGGDKLRLDSNNAKYRILLTTSPLSTKPLHEYVLRIPVTIQEGRVRFRVLAGAGGKALAAQTVDKPEVKVGQSQPVSNVELPFISQSQGEIVVTCEDVAASGRSIVDVAAIELYELRPATTLWTRYPRYIIRGVQTLFITAVMLPLALLGIVILIKRRTWPSLLLLLSVPAYYLCVQSVLHTEYRYVLAVHYFLFIFAAMGLYQLRLLTRSSKRLIRRRGLSPAHPK